jgi:hypothetical protein
LNLKRSNIERTAVEWLSEQFDSIVELYPSQFERVNRAIEQAKEMEKEQIIESFSLGIISHHDAFKNQNKWDNGEQYYNETFKK